MSQNALIKIATIALLLGILTGIFVGILNIFDDSSQSDVKTSTSFSAFLPILIIIIFTGKRRKNFIVLKKIKKSKIKKSKGERSEMLELAKRFIEKDCIIYFFDGSQYTGVVKEVTDNAMLIEEKGQLIAVNLEFVSRIKEYPKNKNGKRKSIAF